ncbi:AraC family transcriptional regulator [Microscilla marina]|uniref:Putative transcriptional regulator n=1 Tax=Microscilla marina ATCC 23134 TaxID=313606 RepID=A1ZYI4_MICM2|nr:AraC family transcriptional regulator [Microscilla marina]EAY24568.1 putative transcriptional regulator [Microscilla marina ATCC 23134]
MRIPQKFYENRTLETLVENQTSYTLNNAEMHVFETHQQAEKVALQFKQPILASMLTGKKIMYFEHTKSFDFLPGESLILPGNETMCIDFPEASLQKPTRCLAMAINEDKIKKIAALLNENMPKIDGNEWRFIDFNFHFTNDVAIHGIIQRLLFLFTENHPSKDIFADFMLKELIIRILQKENREHFSSVQSQPDDHRLTYVIKYIKENLDQPLSIQHLSDQVHMSESNFYRVFKNELGVSPTDFINDERIKLATRLLHDPHKKIKEVYLECGFNSMSYFTRLFKRKKKASPSEFQRKLTQKKY